MLRYIILLFLLVSCATTQEKPDKGVIPTEQINSDAHSTDTNIEDHKLHIGLLIPLSKDKENISSSIIKSSQLAIIDSNNPDIDIVILDSNLISSNPEQLMKDIIDQKIFNIVGPVYSKDTEQFANLTKISDITTLSLSNDTSITADSLLMLGISAESQAKILTSHAISKGIKDFYVLVPGNKYGKLVENAVGEVIDSKYGTSRAVRWYEQDYPDLAIDKIIIEIQQNKDNSDKAIIMPQGGKNLAKLNQALKDAQLNIQLIGSQSWDHPSILKYESFDNALLIRKNIVNPKFAKDFSHFFKTHPSNIDYITYNAIQMLANMYKEKLPITKQTIIENNQISGKYSDITFAPNGSTNYKLEIVEANNGKFKLVGTE